MLTGVVCLSASATDFERGGFGRQVATLQALRDSNLTWELAPMSNGLLSTHRVQEGLPRLAADTQLSGDAMRYFYPAEISSSAHWPNPVRPDGFVCTTLLSPEVPLRQHGPCHAMISDRHSLNAKRHPALASAARQRADRIATSRGSCSASTDGTCMQGAKARNLHGCKFAARWV